MRPVQLTQPALCWRWATCYWSINVAGRGHGWYEYSQIASFVNRGGTTAHWLRATYSCGLSAGAVVAALTTTKLAPCTFSNAVCFQAWLLPMNNNTQTTVAQLHRCTEETLREGDGTSVCWHFPFRFGMIVQVDTRQSNSPHPKHVETSRVHPAAKVDIWHLAWSLCAGRGFQKRTSGNVDTT